VVGCSDSSIKPLYNIMASTASCARFVTEGKNIGTAILINMAVAMLGQSLDL